MSEEINVATDPKSGKKKRKDKLILILCVLAVAAGGAGGAYSFGYIGGDGKSLVGEAGYKLVPKSEQKRASGGAAKEGESGSASGGGKAPPPGVGGDKFASNYYLLDKEFTSNLQDSVHYVQVGIAVSTPYDDTVIENLKTHEIAVRSAVLMALGEATEDEVFTSQGKDRLARQLTAAINATLKQKEGFGGISNVYFTSFVVQ